MGFFEIPSCEQALVVTVQNIGSGVLDMRHFKLPLIVTGIVLPLVLVLGIVGVTWIHQSPISNREKELRGQKLGSGAATMMCVVIGPFWLYAAAKFGKERRAARATPGRRR